MQEHSWSAYLDRRPIVVAIAGSNGAGKSTFFEAHLKTTGLRFLNTDLIGKELAVDAYDAARLVTALRSELIGQHESFIFETVFSDPVGDKLGFLKETAKLGYAVVLCFIGIADVKTSEERVTMRVSQGGHDVPAQKLKECFPRTLVNLSAALSELPCVLIFDNADLRTPYRFIAAFVNGRASYVSESIPPWLKSLLL